MMNLMFALQLMKGKVRSFFTKEDGAVDIVAIVVLIGIAVALAVIFRTQIQGLIERLLGTVEDQATNAVTGGN